MGPIIFLYIGFLLLVGGSVAALATHRLRRLCSWLSFLFVLPAAACFLYLAALVFTGGTIAVAEPLLILPGIGAGLTIAIDPLSALLLLIISIISSCATLFSIQ